MVAERGEKGNVGKSFVGFSGFERGSPDRPEQRAAADSIIVGDQRDAGGAGEVTITFLGKQDAIPPVRVR